MSYLEYGPNFRMIPVTELTPDPDVQLESTFQVVKARKISREWNDDLVGALIVTPDFSASGKPNLIIEGRHRWWAAKEREAPVSLPCRVIPGPLTAEQKADIKMGYDKNRRTVQAIEHFLLEVKAGHPEASTIMSIAQETGWTIGKGGGNSRDHTIVAVDRLRQIHRRGDDQLRRTLKLASTWMGYPKCTNNVWLSGLGFFVLEDYDTRITPTARDRLVEHTPMKLIAIAEADVRSPSLSSDNRAGRIIAEKLRTLSRIRLGKQQLPDDE